MTDNSGSQQAEQQPERRPGQFQPGQSGNPTGRKEGSRNRASILLDRIAEDDAEKILAAQIEKAKEGDQASAALILSRVWPAKKTRSVAVELPKVETATDIMVGLNAILSAVANGNLTPDEGVSIASILEARRKAIETMEIEQRIAALEEKTK